MAKTHGDTPRGNWAPEYRAWVNMHTRCYNKNYSLWESYGGRGISVCQRWHSYEKFIFDVGRRPTPKHTLDRWPDPNGNYEPENVRWATMKEQQRNRTNNRWIEYQGKQRLLLELCEEHRLRSATVRARIKEGWPMEDIFKPVGWHRKFARAWNLSPRGPGSVAVSSNAI